MASDLINGRQSLLWSFRQLAVNVKANGNTAAIDTEDGGLVTSIYCALLVLSGGTAPTVTFTYDHSVDGSQWVEAGATSPLSGPGAVTLSQATPLMRYLRIRWVTTGSPTTATADLHLERRPA